MVREGIKKTIRESTSDIKVQGEASDVKELWKLIKEEVPDLVVLDITMPGQSGLDTLKQISYYYPDLPVLILSMHPEERYAIRALKAGASGYLTKGSVTEDLIRAIKTVVEEKRKFISDTVAEQLAESLDMEYKEKPHETLSDREYQILMMIASGFKVGEIAETLNLSKRTVHTYRSRVLKKMKLSSNVELTRYAMENNLVE